MEVVVLGSFMMFQCKRVRLEAVQDKVDTDVVIQVKTMMTFVLVQKTEELIL